MSAIATDFIVYEKTVFFFKNKKIESFPLLYLGLKRLGLLNLDDILLVYSAHNTTLPEEIEPVGFLTIKKKNSTTITDFGGTEISSLVKVLQVHTKAPINIIIPNSKSNLRSVLQLLLEIGFVSPAEENETVLLTLPYSQSSFTAKLATTKICEALSSNGETSLGLIIEPSFAKKMRDFLTQPNEVAGKIEIKSYTKDGFGVLGVDTIVIGKGSSVKIPRGTISFHTHPNICYIKSGCVIGWASGQDMRFIAEQYLSNQNIILHLIPSKEGIWLINLTVDFQKVLKTIKDSGAIECGKNMLRSIKKVFKDSEKEREKEGMYQQYIYLVNNYKLKNLFNQFPYLKAYCGGVVEDIDQENLLYSVKLARWSVLDNKYTHTISYITDQAGGVKAFVPAEYYKNKFQRF